MPIAVEKIEKGKEGKASTHIALVGSLSKRAVDIISFLHGRLREKHFASRHPECIPVIRKRMRLSPLCRTVVRFLTFDETPDVTEKTSVARAAK